MNKFLGFPGIFTILLILRSTDFLSYFLEILDLILLESLCSDCICLFFFELTGFGNLERGTFFSGGHSTGTAWVLGPKGH